MSTLATPSKHHKELLRLETKLSERESDIAHLTETLQKSEKTSREVRTALIKSEKENQSLQSEVERLSTQLQGIAGFHKKIVALETEHDKSTKRRDQEISTLKSELRLAEDRASQYLTEKKTLEHDLERLQACIKDQERSSRATYQQMNVRLTEYLEKTLEERDKNLRTLQLTKSSSLLENVHYQKLLTDRASQVAELVALVHDSSSREDLLYDTLDILLESCDLQTEQFAELKTDFQSELAELNSCLAESQAEMMNRERISGQILREKDIELEVVNQLISRAKLELEEAQLVRASMEKSLENWSQAYNDLSAFCRAKCDELDNCRDELVTRDGKNAELTAAIQALDSQMISLNGQLDRSKENHLLATETWQLKQCEVRTNLKKVEKELSDEKAKKNKLSAELMLAKQAEAALRGEVEQTRNLRGQLEEVERENDKLKKMNDLILRQSDLNAAEIDKIEKLNIELVSQQNPAQKVKVLDRMRRELKEEKEINAKLNNQLWAAKSEIKSLKDELSAYQSISHPIAASTVHNGVGISRVTRAPLTEVMKRFENQNGLTERKSGDEETNHNKKLIGKPTDKHRELGGFLSRDSAQRDVAPETTPLTQEVSIRPAASRLPINHNQVFRRKKDLKTEKLLPITKIIAETTDRNPYESGEVSLGAIKMQGKMTLDELR